MFPGTVFAVNHFADLKPHELQAHTGLKLSKKTIPQEIVHGFDAPDEFDWRDHNVVTDVKAQLCGNCYIFSAVGNIEGQYALVHKQLLSFSEQQGLDCLKSGSCDGNDIDVFMHELIVRQYKLEKEDAYPPIQAQKMNCSDDPSKGIVLLLNVTFVNMDEETLKNKLVSYGPLSIGLDSTEIKGYAGGILEPQEKSVGYDHALLLVGYGEEDGKKFWIIKNSWGPKWGEGGYLRLVRGVGACGIGGYVVYSAVA